MGFEKAYLQIEGSAGKLDCWFNPTEYSIAKTSKWTAKDVPGASMPPVEYGGGQPRTLTLDLLFDDSDSGTGDVRGVVDELFKLVEIDESLSSNTAKNSGRPPMVTFGWGKASTFKAAVTSLTVKYTLFRADGTPVRATANLSLIQTEAAVASGVGRKKRAQNPTTRGVSGIRSHVVRDGDSLHSIAYQAYGDATLWRVLAQENGIDDPLRLRRGTELAVPRLPE
jgi:nucleoid-associated protein YgaU